MRPVVVSKRTSRTYRPELTLAPGPAVLAQPGEGTYPELYGCPWALALHRDGPQLYQLVAGEWVPRADPGGALLEMVRGVRHVALAWDQAARPVIAWERDALVYVRQWSPGLNAYVTRGPWPGREPLLTCDAVIHLDPAVSDVTLLYLDGAALVARVQRDVYAVRYDLETLPAGAVLDQLVAGGLSWQLAGEAAGAPLVVRSDLYPARLRGRAQGSVSGPTGGALRPVVLVLSPPAESAQGSVSGLTGGAFRPAVLVLSLPAESTQGSVSGLTGGALRPAVLVLSLPAESAQGSVSGPTGGALRLVVVSPSLTPDAAAGSVSGLTGGSFTHDEPSS